MNEEEWIFLIVSVGAGLLGLLIIINDAFSLKRFWSRMLRSRRPPTPQALVTAYNRHQRFYRQTDQRLIFTTYVSFYLFLLSIWGILLLEGALFVHDILLGMDYRTDERLIRMSYMVLFLLISRWQYREETHHVTTHRLITLVSCVIVIDLVHLLTAESYFWITMILILSWLWMGGVLNAVLNYEVNYARDMAFSLGIPFAFVCFLATSRAVVFYFFFLVVLLLAYLENEGKINLKNGKIKHFFPNPLPFVPFRSQTFREDISSIFHPVRVFTGCSVWEVLYWFFLTPLVLVPVIHYLQSREDQLLERHDKIIEWCQNEYVVDPETVADRLGLTLIDTYPLLNELVEEGELTLYESPEGLRYGLPRLEEMDSFIRKFNLHEMGLPRKDREIIHYLWQKGRTRPPTAVLLSVMKHAEGIEVSTEPMGGTIAALKPVAFIDATDTFESISHDLAYHAGVRVGMLAQFNRYEIKSSTFLLDLKKMGNDLLRCTIPEYMMDGLQVSHVVLETNSHDIPFELMCDDAFFAVKYAIGRRLRVLKPVAQRRHEEDEEPRALIIGDPQSNLETALTECEYLKNELDNMLETHYIKGEKATREEVVRCLQEGYAIVHYAGHVSSYGLQLSDGVLDPSTIQTNLRGRPIAFINGCISAGEVNIQVAEAFLRGGAIGYIGSVWDIHDAAAARLAVDFYMNSRLHSMGEALRKAKEKAYQERNIAWLCFVLFGDPTLQLI
jgi:hypothetical protein